MIYADSVKIKDDFIKQVLKSLNDKKFTIDMSLSDELDSLLMVARDNSGSARKIPYGKNGPEDLLKAGNLLAKTQSYKDRVREIDLSFMQAIREFSRLRKKCELYIRRKYAKELSLMKPVAVQHAFIDSILEDIDNKIEDCTFIRDKADIVLQNLTDTHFVLREIASIAKEFIPRGT